LNLHQCYTKRRPAGKVADFGGSGMSGGGLSIRRKARSEEIGHADKVLFLDLVGFTWIPLLGRAENRKLTQPKSSGAFEGGFRGCGLDPGWLLNGAKRTVGATVTG
jgi:hypothetical protein